jgi:sugar lactone lactonase YvrE
VTASGFALIEQDENSKAQLTPLIRALSAEELLYTRLNDGACDARGRFLAATLESTHPGHEFGGALYQYDPSDRSCKMLDNQDITDGNGLGWSKDNKTL